MQLAQIFSSIERLDAAAASISTAKADGRLHSAAERPSLWGMAELSRADAQTAAAVRDTGTSSMSRVTEAGTKNDGIRAALVVGRDLLLAIENGTFDVSSYDPSWIGKVLDTIDGGDGIVRTERNNPNYNGERLYVGAVVRGTDGLAVTNIGLDSDRTALRERNGDNAILEIDRVEFSDGRLISVTNLASEIEDGYNVTDPAEARRYREMLDEVIVEVDRARVYQDTVETSVRSINAFAADVAAIADDLATQLNAVDEDEMASSLSDLTVRRALLVKAADGLVAYQASIASLFAADSAGPPTGSNAELLSAAPGLQAE